jgi:hypothetical protein
MVKIALWGLSKRSTAWIFFLLALVLAVGCVLYGFADQRFFLGGGFIFAALWYYLSIRWVDQNSSWS